MRRKRAAKSVTPAQTEGPFYPDMDNDLTRVQGKEKLAGKFIYVHGNGFDEAKTGGTRRGGNLADRQQRHIQPRR